MVYSKDAKRQAQAATIVHFTGSSKPWHYMNNHPLKREYLGYLSRTEWKGYKYPDYSLRNFIYKTDYSLRNFIYENVYRFVPFKRFPIWRRYVRPAIRGVLSHRGEG